MGFPAWKKSHDSVAPLCFISKTLFAAGIVASASAEAWWSSTISPLASLIMRVIVVASKLKSSKQSFPPSGSESVAPRRGEHPTYLAGLEAAAKRRGRPQSRRSKEHGI